MRFSCCKCRRIRSSRKVRWREDFGSKITGKWRFETPGTSWRFETSWGSPKSSSRHGWPWLSMETHGDDWGSPIWRNSHMRSEPSWRAHHRSTWTLNNNRSVTAGWEIHELNGHFKGKNMELQWIISMGYLSASHVWLPEGTHECAHDYTE
jgi:hypothetical protein